MACKGFLDCSLKLLNFPMTCAGLAMIAYRIYLFVEYEKSSSGSASVMPTNAGGDLVKLGQPILLAVPLSPSFLDDFPKAWSGSCHHILIRRLWKLLAEWCRLTLYTMLVFLLILVELGCAGAIFIYFDKSWEDDIWTDKTSEVSMIYSFLKENWKIIRGFPSEYSYSMALIFVLALLVRAANDSDEEFTAPRQQIRQLLMGRPLLPATSVPVATGPLDPWPSGNDAWSTQNEGKAAQPSEEKGRCAIM